MPSRTEVEVTKALASFPYFILKNEIKTGYNLYTQELLQIKKNYVNYKKGSDFYPEGSAGDYVPSTIKYKIARRLLNKEARFMFSQTPDIVVKQLGTNEEEKKQVEIYQKIVDGVIKKSHFSKALIQSAKDCFIGKRVACLADISEKDGILLHFYSSLQFYYEMEEGTDRLTKFISFENVTESKSMNERRYLVNKYEDKNGTIYMSSIIYTGNGKVETRLIPEKAIDLDYIPAVIITNDGTLEEKRGVSEMEYLIEQEGGYSKLANADIDSLRKGMNPIRYVVDMNSATTKGLSSSAGSFWDLKSEQTQENVSPMVGTLSPQLNHSEVLKETLNRLESSMYEEIEVPNITAETMVGTITSGKALKTLYFPLQTRSDEKMKTWIPCLQAIMSAVIDLALLNADLCKEIYTVSDLKRIQYDINIKEHYALVDDETEEKQNDMSEINVKARSRHSYIKKWRPDLTDEQIREELLQIAVEENMFDTMSMNTQVQDRLSEMTTKKEIDDNIETIEAQNNL